MLVLNSNSTVLVSPLTDTTLKINADKVMINSLFMIKVF